MTTVFPYPQGVIGQATVCAEKATVIGKALAYKYSCNENKKTQKSDFVLLVIHRNLVLTQEVRIFPSRIDFFFYASLAQGSAAPEKES